MNEYDVQLKQGCCKLDFHQHKTVYHNAQVRHGRGCQSQTAAVAAKRNRLEWLPRASLCRFGAGSLIGSLLLGKLAASWAFAHTHTAPVRGLSCSMAPLVEGIFPTLAGRSNISRQCCANRKQRADDADDLWKGNSAVVAKV